VQTLSLHICSLKVHLITFLPCVVDDQLEIFWRVRLWPDGSKVLVFAWVNWGRTRTFVGISSVTTKSITLPALYVVLYIVSWVLRMVKYCEWWITANGEVLRMVNYCEWWITANGEVLRMVKYCEWWSTANDELLRMVKYCEWWITANGELLRMVKYYEWWRKDVWIPFSLCSELDRSFFYILAVVRSFWVHFVTVLWPYFLRALFAFRSAIHSFEYARNTLSFFHLPQRHI
jgi:hypothetical protein